MAQSGADGETDGFAAFVAARYPALARSAFLLLGDRGYAEDLVQSALIKTFQRWSRLESPVSADAYTRTVMLHMARRWSRRKWRAEIPGTDVLDTTSSTDQDATVRADVRRAIAALPWHQRAVLVLRYLDDLSEKETAAILGCSTGTVKSRASRALERLRSEGLLEPVADRGGNDG
jgi:RNA polymerase sigma-70 factor (sigma-E family)